VWRNQNRAKPLKLRASGSGLKDERLLAWFSGYR
jgi:hypothetical protein